MKTIERFLDLVCDKIKDFEKFIEDFEMLVEHCVDLYKSSHFYFKKELELSRTIMPKAGVKRYIELSKHNHPVIRRNLAQRPFLPRPVQLALAQDPDRNVRLSLAKNNTVSSEACEILVYDEEFEIREIMTRKPDLSEKAKWALCIDESYLIRNAMLKRKDLDVHQRSAAGSNLTGYCSGNC